MLVQLSLALLTLVVSVITAVEGKYPYHVSIRLKGVHICSGSIINNRHILTSQSCLISTSLKDLSVVAGTNSLIGEGTSYKIQEVIVPNEIFDDIALIRTRNDIIFSYNIDKIDITNYRYDKYIYLVTITAWEQPPPGEERKNENLQQFFHKLYDRDLCLNQFNLFGKKYICTIDPSSQGLCNMDYGGAIVANGVQIGINLNNNQCVDGNKPKAHTSVYEYAKWIKRNSIINQIPHHWITPRPCVGNNHEAPYGKYPYHVSVRRNNEHICSGSIINNRYIITSQFCVIRDSPNDISVIVGTSSLSYPGILYRIENIITSGNDDNFIALLQTEQNIKFNSDVTSIDIKDYTLLSNGDVVILTAWEQPSNVKITSDRLQEFSHKIYDLKMCGKRYGDNFDRDYMCTIDPCYNNICNMDYGGAIVANGYQIGIKLYMNKCTAGEPQVHFRIDNHASWIKQQSDLKKFSRSSVTVPFKATSEVGKLSHDAPDGKYPYHVSIRRNYQHICSGSIINKRHVLTSRDCIARDEASDLIIIAGMSSLINAGYEYRVNEIIPSPHFDYDIAILRTTHDINFNNDVEAIHIIQSRNEIYNYQRIILTGWERPIAGKYMNNKLQQISYQVYNRNKCMETIPFLNEAYMCSIKPSYKNACNIDYGGPIVANGVQVAINPFGVRCENNNEPHVHLPLYQHSKWIRDNSRL